MEKKVFFAHKRELGAELGQARIDLLTYLGIEVIEFWMPFEAVPL